MRLRALEPRRYRFLSVTAIPKLSMKTKLDSRFGSFVIASM